MCKITICPKVFNALPPHGLHQCHQIPLRYGVPLLLQKLEELSKVYEVKRGPVLKMDVSPYHQRPSSMTIVLANTSISKALSLTPPDALSGVIVAETVPRLICE